MARMGFYHPCVVAMLVAASILLLTAGSAAQETKAGDIILPEIGSGNVDAYIEALKSDLQKHTRKVIEVNMQLTEKESALFWPIYNRYDYDMGRLNFERASIYGFYANNYRTMTDGQARDLIKRLNSVERRKLTIDEKYAREMAKAMPVRTVLRFLQIERQVDRLVSLKIISGIPLIPTDASKAKPEAGTRKQP